MINAAASLYDHILMFVYVSGELSNKEHQHRNTMAVDGAYLRRAPGAEEESMYEYTPSTEPSNMPSQGRVNCLFLMCVVFLQHRWRVDKECAWQHYLINGLIPQGNSGSNHQ